MLIVDGAQGTLTLADDEAVLQAARAQAERVSSGAGSEAKRAQATLRNQPGATGDGHRVPPTGERGQCGRRSGRWG